MTRFTSRAPVALAIAALLAVVPETVFACPVCFGASDAPAAQGMNLAIFTLLGVTGSVLASFLGFIAYLMKRANAVRTGAEWHESAVDPSV